MSYMRGIVVEYQYKGAGIGIVLLVVKNLPYPIPKQYQYSICKAALRNKEITENLYFECKQNAGARTPSAN
jgi:hypothetical protein